METQINPLADSFMRLMTRSAPPRRSKKQRMFRNPC